MEAREHAHRTREARDECGRGRCDGDVRYDSEPFDEAEPHEAREDEREALIDHLRTEARRLARYNQPCGVPGCPFMVRRGDGGWSHLDTHGSRTDHPAIGCLDAAADALAQKHPETKTTDDELRTLSDAARPGPWRAYETVQADNFIVEDKQGFLNGPGPVMGPSYDKSTVEYVVALVNRHRASLAAVGEGEQR